jgi:ribosomal protein L11 methylase PrmA
VWGRWPTMEGGYLIDRRAVDEAVDALGLTLPDRDGEARLRAALIGLIDADVERCPHGRPLGVDLALPDGGANLGLDLLAGPAMGSGRWPWTRTLLRALERHLPAGARVADVGTGTGILGLIALQHGAAEVDAVDTDPLTCAIARRNVRRNGAAGRMRVVERLERDYDLAIVAVGGVEELPVVMGESVRRVKPGGLLIASPAHGAAERAQLHGLLASLRLSNVEELVDDDWHAVVARVSSTP